MSLAYFIVLDREDLGFDPFINGKFLAKDARRLNKAAKKLGLKRLDDFVSYEEGSAPRLLARAAGANPTQWFDPDEGAVWARTLLERFRDDPRPLKHAEGVISDLEECLVILEKAKAAGTRWHFAIDI